MTEHPETGILIRPCTVDDAPALAALARRTFYDTFTGTCSEADMQHFLDTFYNEATVTAELADPEDHIYFAMNGDQPAGFLRFLSRKVPFPYNSALKPLELNRLYVDQSYKGKGVARQLMDVYLGFAARHDCRYLWLGVWENNFRAQAFYRRYGFSFTGYRHPFPIGNTPQTDEWWALEMKE